MANPRNKAATEAPCPRASTTSTTGQPVTRASSAVEPASPSRPVPSNSPITPSQRTMSAPASRSATSPARVAGRIPQTSRFTQGLPEAAAWKVGSIKSGPAFAVATPSLRSRKCRARPAVTKVLPLPDAGAARISPRPVTTACRALAARARQPNRARRASPRLGR